jgi:eukaryotic-like serine/threonine-protein kinase
MEPEDRLGFVGKYRLLAKLGQGGMANVFLAVSQGPAAFNKLVVVKRLHSDIAESESHITMFLDEAKLSARLNHPNIVHTYEIGETDSAYYIVMEYLEGQPLNHVARAVARAEPGADGFTRGTWIRIVAEVLSGLHYAHELCDYDGTPLGIVHRDISPHNIFVTYDGGVKVVDFGIAKAAINTARTVSGVFKGKVCYMAPEQAHGVRTLDRRADVFAVGIVLWELLAQKRLFSGDPIDTLRRLVSDEMPRLSTVAPDIPAALDDIVARALDRNPEMRFSTAQEMRQALAGYMRSTGEDIRMDELGARMSSVFEGRRATMRQRISAELERSGQHDDSGHSSSSTQGGGSRGPLSLRGRLVSLPTFANDSGLGSSLPHRIESDSASLRAATVPASSLNRGYLVGAVGVVALVVGAAFRLRSPARQPPADPLPPAVAPAAQEAGALRITSEPPEATVSWEGRVLGKTPLRVDLPAGTTQSVIVSSPGFFEETLIVMVSPSQNIERAVALRHKESAGAASAEPAAPARRPSGGGRGAPKVAAPQPPPSVAAPPAAAAPQPVPTARPGIKILTDEPKPAVNVKIIH